MTLRCALHARYSSDQQRPASIEDQFRVCRERAEREGWKMVGTYRDSAISGDSVILRPGVQALLEDARRGAFEIVVAEALDRVSRDKADVALLYKHLRFAGVMIVTLSEGEISELHVGLKGTMNALFLKDARRIGKKAVGPAATAELPWPQCHYQEWNRRPGARPTMRIAASWSRRQHGQPNTRMRRPRRPRQRSSRIA